MRLRLAILLALSGTVFGQGVRFDNRTLTTATNVPVNANTPVLAMPNSMVTICVSTGCPVTASIYSNSALTVPQSNPIKADGQGRFGFWAASGSYFYQVQAVNGAITGPYPITLGGAGAAGINALTGDVIASGVGSVGATLATVNGNVGSCGDATHVGQVVLDAKGRTVACSPVAIAGGGVPNTAGSVQYANNGATAFASGGTFNSDVFASGSGNNGIANLQASPACANGCDFIIPATSTDTETVFNTTMQNGSHAQDRRNGALTDAYINPDPTSNAPIASFENCLNNIDPVTGATNQGNCFVLNDAYAEPGIDVEGAPTTHNTLTMFSNFYGAGIHQSIGINEFCMSNDDCGGIYLNQFVRASNTAGSSESNVLESLEQTESAGTAGTITTGGSGATTIATTTHLVNSAALVSKSEIIASGFITGGAAGSGLLLNSFTTSDTHAVSTGYGFLTAACGSATPRNAPLSNTCAFTTSVGFGAFVATAGSIVAVGDFAFPECAKVTSVSGGTITLGLTYPHPSGTPIYQGAGSCGIHILGNGLTDPTVTASGSFPNYFTAGARTSTSWDYIVQNKQGENGNIQLTIPSISATIISASRSGTTVTLTLGGAGGAPIFNGYTAPSGASICVTGNSDSSFNVCGISGIVSSNGALTLTYTSGSAATSGTGGTIAVATTAAPTSNGLANYEVACGAEVTKVLGITLALEAGNGSAELSPNNCAWTAGAAVIQPNSQNQNFEGLRVISNAFTPSETGPNGLIDLSVSGPAWSGGNIICFACEESEPLNKFNGYGGGEFGYTLFKSDSATVSNFFQLNFAPFNNGTIFNVGPIVSGGPGFTSYKLFNLQGAGGIFTQVSYNTVTNTFTISGIGGGTTTQLDALSVGGSATVGQNAIVGNTVFANQISFGTPGNPANLGFATTGNGMLYAGDGVSPVDVGATISAGEYGAGTLYAGAAPPASGMGVLNTCAAGTTTWFYVSASTTANGTSLPSAPFNTTVGNANPACNTVNLPLTGLTPGQAGAIAYRWKGTGSSSDPTQYGQVCTSTNAQHGCVDPGTTPGAAPNTTDTTGGIGFAGVISLSTHGPLCQLDGTHCPAAGSVATIASMETIASSATPTFTTTTRASINTLTANVTTFTLPAGADGQEKTLAFCQNGTGGFTVTPPSNVHGFGTVGATASKCSTEHFTYYVSQSAWLADGAMISNE
jgi:hypothetical protein